MIFESEFKIPISNQILQFEDKILQIANISIKQANLVSGSKIELNDDRNEKNEKFQKFKIDLDKMPNLQISQK